ncbi:MAG: acetylornithine deacetylase [Burkholderiales bacterium]|jgi:succinyl-diaminopimelate desuccinylase|nr:acetylornithine deacetylase [Burkholderiales bacterium]
MTDKDAVSLTRSLLAFDTINPPGRERDCARMAGAILEESGFSIQFFEYEEGRTSLVARAGGSDAKAPLCLTGHLDVVPLGSRKWSKDPFSGESDGDKLYGRGTSDMKSGVAAMLLAARTFGKSLSGTPGIVLVLTAGEEGGCIGSRHLAGQRKLLGRAGAMVVGEPTSNYPLVGHKGSIKFNARFRGVSAHGSMPELGVNAVYKAAAVVTRLENFEFGAAPHAVMGKPTLNVGTFAGGSGVNLVPDDAVIGVDIRTVPGLDHGALLSRLKDLLGKDAELDVFSDLNPVWTAPDQEWVQRVFEICKPFVGEAPHARTAPYMTDAANLLKAYVGAPAVVLGPGEAAMAHQTDEYCSIERTRQAVAIYEAVIKDWCKA